MWQTKMNYAKKMYITQLCNVGIVTFVLGIHFLFIVFQSGESGWYQTSIVTALVLLTFFFLYQDLHRFPSREETRIFVTTLAVMTVCLVLVGLALLLFAVGHDAKKVYLGMVSVPAWFGVGIAAFDQARREQAVSTVQYKCLRAKQGNYSAYVVYQVLVYILFPFGISCIFIVHHALGVLFLVGYIIGSTAFISYEYYSRTKKKKSFFWKPSIAKK